MKFSDLLSQVIKTRKFERPEHLLVFDPGGTTGWAYFKHQELEKCGQLNTKDLQNIAKDIYGTVAYYTDDPDESLVLYENYRVYGHKQKQHVGSELHTAKVIGIIESVCQLLGVKTHNQMASLVKPFCTDQKLREWGWYQTTQKHANDAIRHGSYYLLFGGKLK